MRLALLTTIVSPYHDARFRAVARSSFDVTVVATKNEGHFAQFLACAPAQDYAIEQLFANKEQYREALSDGRLVRSINQVLSRVKPEVAVVSGWYSPDSLAALAYGREVGVPVVVMSESQGHDAARSLLREAVKRRVVSQFDAALVGGPPHADYVESLGIPRGRIHYGYNAIDNDHFTTGAEAARANSSFLRARYNLPERYVLASARFIPKKNLPSLVTAYAAARARLGNAPDLVVLGDGPERAAVETAILSSRVGNNVHLPGFRDYDDLPAYYGLSEAFVHVSTVEQWGLVINEAMATGVPVVASRQCGAARTLLEDGVSGILTGTDVPAISDALVKLFKMTPNERVAMGRVGAATIDKWGPQCFGAGMKAAVESALNAPRRGRLAPWDRVLLSRLQKTVIDAVA